MHSRIVSEDDLPVNVSLVDTSCYDLQRHTYDDIKSITAMTEDFQSDHPIATSPDNPLPLYNPADREPVRLIVVSTKRGVTSMIHTLHLRGVATADEWSPLQPEPMTGKWMSIVTKYV